MSQHLARHIVKGFHLKNLKSIFQFFNNAKATGSGKEVAVGRTLVEAWGRRRWILVQENRVPALRFH